MLISFAGTVYAIENVGGVETLAGLEEVFANLVASLLAVAGVALFVMLLIGGFKYLTSSGDPKATESAKKTLTYAIGGMIVVAMAYLFLKFIADYTGVNRILNFRVRI